MTFVLTLGILLLMAAGLLAMLNLGRDERSRQIQALAPTLDADFSRLAALDRDLARTPFELFLRGQVRHARNQLAGRAPLRQDEHRYFKIMDYSLLGDQGVEDQTLILVQCGPVQCGSLCISHQKAAKADAFTDLTPEQRHSCQREQLPVWARTLRISAEKPHALEIWLNSAGASWLQAHPQLEVEWSSGLLLVYRPNCQIAAGQLEDALAQVLQLAALLEKKPPEGGF